MHQEPHYPDEKSESSRLYSRAAKVMPGGNSRTTVYRAPYPVYAKAGTGSRVRDADGVERLDFLNNYTALIHGHAHPEITRAATRALQSGTCFGMPTESEITLAELLAERNPSFERIRFTNSGTEAVMTAVKAARAYTGRPKIAKCEGAYHGTYDVVEVSLDPTTKNWGDVSRPASVPHAVGTPAHVMSDVVVLPFNQPEIALRILNEHAQDLAAVLIDPLSARIGMIPVSREFLDMLQGFCSRSGVLLISDEVISFRVAYNGPQALFGYRADLTTLGKIIGGGFPVGAVAGNKDVMAVFDPTKGRAAVTHGGTFNANPITMTAGLKALELITPDAMNRLNSLGDAARELLNGVFNEAGLKWQVTGIGSLFHVVPVSGPLVDYRSSHANSASGEKLRAFSNSLLNHGILSDSGGMGCLSTPMVESDIEALASAFHEAIAELGVSELNA